jgi:hypothetical protein
MTRIPSILLNLSVKRLLPRAKLPFVALRFLSISSELSSSGNKSLYAIWLFAFVGPSFL